MFSHIFHVYSYSCDRLSDSFVLLTLCLCFFIFIFCMEDKSAVFHCLVLVVFGRNAKQKLGNQKLVYLPTLPSVVFALLANLTHMKFACVSLKFTRMLCQNGIFLAVHQDSTEKVSGAVIRMFCYLDKC